jgi:hypothetical protein
MALPGTYSCELDEEVSFDTTNGLLAYHDLTIEFTVPRKNADRMSDIENVVVKYDYTSTKLISYGKTEKFGEIGSVFFKNVAAEKTSTGGVDYPLGDTLSGFSTLLLNLPKLAKNINRNSEATLWFTNNLRRIMTDIKLTCFRN